MSSECNLKHTRSNSPRSPITQANARLQAEQILQNALLLTEMGMELKDQTLSGQKYVSYLRNLSLRAAKIMSILQSSSKTFLLLAQKTLQSGLDCTLYHDQNYSTVKSENDKLLSIIEKELGEIEEIEHSLSSPYGMGGAVTVADKIKHLEERQKLSDNCLLPPTSSAKSVKSDVNEKYPENLSRESLIDLNNVVNLPTVPEDIFTGFVKPAKTSSLSSLKSMRKVKLFLQRASSASDEDDESSETEDHEYSKLTGDYEEGRCVTFTPPKKVYLGNITEEAQQD